MNLKTKLFKIIILLYLYACATVNAPPGGKKDEQAPIILKTIPKHKSTNQNTNLIEIFFNEKIADNKLSEHLIINPLNPDVTIQTYIAGKTLKIKLKPNKKSSIKTQKPLKDSTTYTVQLNNAVKDITEGNVIQYGIITFSTGNTLDTNTILFSAKDYYTHKPIENYIVGLYPTHDSLDPRKHLPLYYNKTEKNQTTRISNIKPGKYKVIAHTNKNLYYDDKKDKIYFDTTIYNFENIDEIKDTIILKMAKTDIRKPKISSLRNDNEISIQLTEGIINYSITGTNDSIISKLENKGKEIIIFKNQYCEDTVTANLYLQDSSYNDTTLQLKFTYSLPSKIKKYKNLIKDIEPKSNTTFSDSIPFKIKLFEPIIEHKDSIGLLIIDSIDFIPIYIGKHFKINHTKTELEYLFTTKKKIKKYVQLALHNKAFYTFKQDTSASLTYTYYLKDINTIQKNFEDDITTNIYLKTNRENYIYHLLDEKGSIIDERFNPKEIQYINLKPGKYDIRIIIDENKNGWWDLGNFYKKQLPEEIIYFKDILKIVQNWDVDAQTIEF